MRSSLLLCALLVSSPSAIALAQDYSPRHGEPRIHASASVQNMTVGYPVFGSLRKNDSLPEVELRSQKSSHWTN